MKTRAFLYLLLAVSNVLTSMPCATALPGEAKVGTDLRIAHMRLSIWPEYDDPRVLVMFRGELASGSTLPTRITLPIPKGADILGAGMISEQNELLLHPHQVLPGKVQDQLELNLPTTRFFVEFYYDPFTAGPDKRFTYTFPTTYVIERLEVDVQQPLQATKFSLSPRPTRQESDERGFTYHWFSYRNLKRDEPLSLTISYTKPVTAPSITKRPSNPTAQSRPTHPMVIAFGLLAGAAVVFAGSTWLWRGYGRRLSPTVPQGPLSTTTENLPAAVADGINFCSGCGRNLQPGYRFCPGCGKLVRQNGDGENR